MCCGVGCLLSYSMAMQCPGIILEKHSDGLGGSHHVETDTYPQGDSVGTASYTKGEKLKPQIYTVGTPVGKVLQSSGLILFPQESAGREQALKSWWEEVPIGSNTDDPRPTRAILSRKHKREQRQWYAQRTEKGNRPAKDNRIYTIAGEFRQKQHEDPSLKHGNERFASPGFVVEASGVIDGPPSGCTLPRVRPPASLSL
ncbi:hypothetical protein NDU88_006871 [Pleurodeles waltl]|uniref:Uncharacterized protein n=1 Tax=Pleurodeles waltl TaxID=8319 RepID=A0AAV7QKA7_PLEWA|nr:hypothetical protein NDU88_006871 [Pleurodeles waltl]